MRGRRGVRCPQLCFPAVVRQLRRIPQLFFRIFVVFNWGYRIEGVPPVTRMRNSARCLLGRMRLRARSPPSLPPSPPSVRAPPFSPPDSPSEDMHRTESGLLTSRA
ncbi:hypothetical protein F2P81_019473 [Scophthalmus maximus]|uniref:Uncharacterized protein n=1 Tax=Scophthalmus maximus TaxID=52904 RepID=A0A6A4RZN9_SCOMX|nr:hypothetical protein F2P81_019473 [Scophthalmus maximus]